MSERVPKAERHRRRREIFAWTLYDFANTAFSVIVVTVVYAVYFKKYIVGDLKLDFLGLNRNPGDLLWGFGGALSMFLVAVSSPVLGAIADYSSRKKRFLFVYSMVCILATISLYFLSAGMIWQGMLLFIIGDVGFEGAIVFYNGFLPQISHEDNIGKISGYGFALGYVGSLVSLLIAMPYANQAFIHNDLSLMRPAFIWAGLFFFVFSLPIYIMLNETKNPVRETGAFIKTGYERVRKTLRKIRRFPQITRFLISYFVYIDGVNTVIYFSGIYASDTLGFSMKEVIQFFAIVQASAISGSYVFGYLTDKLGPKKTIHLTLLMWMLVTIGGFLARDALTFYVVGLVAGMAMGSSQSASRALMGRLIPAGMEAEFFGFYALTGKFSAIMGPLLFGLTSTVTGNQRYAVLSVLVFFVAGFLLLRRVDERVTYKDVVL